MKKALKKQILHGSLLSLSLALLGFCLVPSLSLASQTGKMQSRKAHTLAQQLVEQSQTNHPDATEIGISARSAHGCTTIASTDPGDIGEKCEKEDIAPLADGKPHAQKESDGFDVSVPLRDAAGKMIGALAVEFKPETGHTRQAVIAQAEKIAREMAPQIASKSKLFEPAK